MVTTGKMGNMSKRSREKGSELNSLTGLYKRTAFFREARRFIDAQKQDCCLMALDIEHFKLFNDWYGRAEGDQFLVKIAAHLKHAQEQYDGVAGYMGGDDFCILLRHDTEVLCRIQEQITDEARRYDGNAGFLPAFGVYSIETNNTLEIYTIYDRAVMAVATVKGNYARRSCWYDNRMKEEIEEEYKMLSDVQRALREGEFFYYLQPQCNISTGKVIGFESLVRWDHPERGMISPGEFIPMLEKNGFITNLNKFLWEKVCIQLHRWLAQGLKLVPISVNVSRVDMYTMDVVGVFCDLVKKYGLEPGCIEIEITESAYVEEHDLIAGVVDRLRKAGFFVLMDDFGSGYSSLNMLKDVNVDVLKLDMKFLNMNEQSAGKGVGILDAVAGMTRILGIQLIAEGVETEAQVKMLNDMGCLYGQGYYFYRPMPVETCEKLLREERNMDYQGMKAARIDSFLVKELLKGDIFSEVTLNNIIGAAGICEVFSRQIRLRQANGHFCRLVGYDRMQLLEHATEMDLIAGKDRAKLLRTAQKAYQDRLYGAECDIYLKKENGSFIRLHIRIFFMYEDEGHQYFFGAAGESIN